VLIRKAESTDADAIASIIVPVIREGTTYTLDSDMSEADALAYWMGPDKETFVAEEDGIIVGCTRNCTSAAWPARYLSRR
jgi:hypothetical protein